MRRLLADQSRRALFILGASERDRAVMEMIEQAQAALEAFRQATLVHTHAAGLGQAR